ncbi:MAG: aldehyde dehydrogenase family protein [Terriglobales bacterium]
MQEVQRNSSATVPMPWRRGLFIGGREQPASSGKVFITRNPATGEVLAEVAEADAADIDRAVTEARRALESEPWRDMAARDRGRLLRRLAELIERHGDELAELETRDNGKPIFESRQVDLPEVAAVFDYYAGWADKIEGSVVPVSGGHHVYTMREPVGVVGAITPWNFPLILAAWKLAPALACGCTVVHKPAEQTPLTALRLAELANEAGFPPGVLNVLPGLGPTAGAALARHPGVDKIAFTGSTAVGHEVMRLAAATNKRVSLELGGKSPNLVFPDADLDAAVRGAYNAIFYGKGEVCAAGSRLLVARSIHDEFLAKLVERTRKLIPGDPLHPKTKLGALVSEEQMERVLGYIEAGRREGAELVLGGGRVNVPGFERGNFVAATIFDRVRPEMNIAREEIFGPVLATLEFQDFDDAIARANDTCYGLAAAVWTRDLRLAHRAARALKAGTVWVNTYNQYDPAAPFGGFRQSGFGRELGRQALDLYTETKCVWVNWQT